MNRVKRWEQLKNYESFELVKKDYFERHGRTPNTAHAREIAAAFAHSRSYFMAAQDAEQTVKPLLLYYGVVSLSRGMTLALSRGMREAALAQAHGLSVREWNDELSKENPDFSLLTVEVNQAGSFLDLAQATGNRSLLRHNSSGVNYRHENPPIAPQSQYALGDILARLPALQDHYRRWEEVGACSMFQMQVLRDSDEVVFKIPRLAHLPHVTRAFADAIFQNSNHVFQSETPEFFEYRCPNDQQVVPGMTDHTTHWSIGDVWLTRRHPNGSNLSSTATLFLLSYMLGMLVRYFPTKWTALVRSQIGDSALPTIAAAIDLIEDEYPRVVLDFMLEKRQ
ncbi:YaaC family protein [Cupriavidus sp.]|uniref:YaaC family protein n=1 Tax=Cupriavidus sp. TaxID=1873897 RepID=UPI0028BF1D74|nr:YaaC family protein [Cupriavidus sp.]